MEYEKVLSLVKDKRKGNFGNISWHSPIPLQARFKNQNITVVKKSMIDFSAGNKSGIRLGVNYRNIQSVKDRIPVEKANIYQPELPWGKWVDGLFPFIIEHNGNKYLRITLNPDTKIVSEYYINGEPATVEDCKNYCIASAFKKHNKKPEVLTINVDNIEYLRYNNAQYGHRNVLKFNKV